MSRRPAYDEGVATVVVLDHSGENVQQQYQYQNQQNQPNTNNNIYKSNLLSNENVIAFASGVVIDDGSSVVTNSPQIPIQKSMNVNTPSANRFQNVSRR